MKKLLTLILLATLFISCSSDDDLDNKNDYSTREYRYQIINNLGKDIDIVIFRSYESKNKDSNYDDEIMTFDLPNGDSTIEYKTTYPYVNISFSYHDWNSTLNASNLRVIHFPLGYFPSKDGFFEMRKDELNIINITSAGSD